MILDETYEFIKNRYGDQFDELKIADVRLGAHLSAVKLSDNSYGVASILNETDEFRVKGDRDFGEFTPGKITQRSVRSLFEIEKKSAIIDTLRIAALNAIASRLIDGDQYKIIENVDPVELIDNPAGRTVTIVGAFRSYIEKFSRTRSRLYVLELNEHAIAEPHKKYFVPAGDYQRVIPESDIIIITGSTLVNNTIDGLLEAVRPGSTVIVTGPSSSLVPDVLFRKGVTVIGATRIQDTDILFKLVSEFGAGFHLFKYCAQKICILNEQVPRPVKKSG